MKNKIYVILFVAFGIYSCTNRNAIDDDSESLVEKPSVSINDYNWELEYDTVHVAENDFDRNCELKFKSNAFRVIPIPAEGSHPMDLIVGYFEITLIDSKTNNHDSINHIIGDYILDGIFESTIPIGIENIMDIDSFYGESTHSASNSIEWCSESIFSTKIEYEATDRFGTISYKYLNFNLTDGSELKLESLVPENKRNQFEEYVRDYCERHKIDNVKYYGPLYQVVGMHKDCLRCHDQTLMEYLSGIDWTKFLFTNDSVFLFQKIYDMNPIDHYRRYRYEHDDTIRIGKEFMPVTIPFDSLNQFISLEIN